MHVRFLDIAFGWKKNMPEHSETCPEWGEGGVTQAITDKAIKVKKMKKVKKESE